MKLIYGFVVEDESFLTTTSGGYEATEFGLDVGFDEVYHTTEDDCDVDPWDIIEAHLEDPKGYNKIGVWRLTQGSPVYVCGIAVKASPDEPITDLALTAWDAELRFVLSDVPAWADPGLFIARLYM